MLFVVAWPVSGAVVCAVKRPEEADADRAGVQYLVGKKLISAEDAREALTLISRFNLHDPDPNWLAWLLFYDHPSLTERLRNIDDTARLLGTETAKK